MAAKRSPSRQRTVPANQLAPLPKSDVVEQTLRSATRHLRKLRARFALVGGFAVSARSEPRFTRDVDFTVDVQDDSEAEGLLFRMTSLGYQIKEVFEHDSGRLSTARLQHRKYPGVFVDLLFYVTGIEHAIVEEADRLRIFSAFSVPVATLSALFAMKTVAGRRRDLDDIEAMLNVASKADVRQAFKLLKAIDACGIFVGKRSAQTFQQLIDDFGKLLRQKVRNL